MIPVMRLFMQRGFDVTLMCMMSDMFVERYEGEFHLINVKMNRGISLKDMLTKPFEFYKIFKREKFNYVQYATTNAACFGSCQDGGSTCEGELSVGLALYGQYGLEAQGVLVC